MSRLRDGGDTARLEALEWRDAGRVAIRKGQIIGDWMGRSRHTLAAFLQSGGLGHFITSVWILTKFGRCVAILFLCSKPSAPPIWKKKITCTSQ